MSKETIHLPAILVEELFEDKYYDEHHWITSDVDGADWRYVAVQRDDSNRWMEYWILVVERADDTFWAVDYAMGLTENQPNELPWRQFMWGGEAKTGDIEAYRVYPHTVTSVEYCPTSPSSPTT